MIKWIACIVVGSLIGALLYLLLFQNPEPMFVIAPPPIKGEVKDTPRERYEILYDRDNGECSVITRSENGLVSESLFNSTVVNDCYEYTMENERTE